MAAQLKTFFDAALVADLAGTFRAADPAFAAAAFAAEASRGLEALELMDRALWIAAVLGRHLPADFPAAARVVERSLGPELDGDELLGRGMAPFRYLPHVLWVAQRGLGHFEEALRLQHALTRRFSCEFSIRAYLQADPARTLARLREWAGDANPHVRRLVSEGTRPRLPWASRLSGAAADPRPVLALLELLRDDPTTLVRRSVANHLNDLSKDDPALALATCRRWLRGAPPERRALVHHALRSLLRTRHPGALGLVGHGGRPEVALGGLTATPRRVAVGGQVVISFTLASRAARAQPLRVDLAVHFVKASGKARPKAFRVASLTLPARGEVALEKRISLAVHSTRTPNPGRHRVELVVNGATLGEVDFEVVSPARAGPRRTRRPRGGSAA